MRVKLPQPTYDSWAKYYDLAEADRSTMIDFYGSLVAQNVRSILELGCGTGAILVALAERVRAYQGSLERARITGVDESKNMLRIARLREASFEWLLGDMRFPPVEGSFDLIFCNFNTLQFCASHDELVQTFKSARDLLATGGIFAFDLYQPSLPYLSLPQRDRLVRRVVDPMGKEFEVREDASYDPSCNVYDVSWRIQEPGADKKSAVAHLNFCYHQYSALEVERAVTQAGLAIHDRFGNLDRSPFTENSKKQVVVCGAE